MRKRWIALSFTGLVVTALLLARVLRSSPDDRWSLACFQLEHIASTVELYRADTGQWPASLDALTRFDGPGLGPYLSRKQRFDPWGHALFYGIDADSRGFVVFTLGRDGRLGGTGADADIQRGARDQIPRK